LYTLVVSPDIIEETKEVFQSEYLRKKYNLELLEIERLLTSLRLSAELSTPIPVQELPIHCRDLKDDRLLALAFGGNAQYLITGDKDLLILNGNRKLGKLKIMTVKEFLSVLRF
jgi:putative PIN family toxin of toxin-antitoxin system